MAYEVQVSLAMFIQPSEVCTIVTSVMAGTFTITFEFIHV